MAEKQSNLVNLFSNVTKAEVDWLWYPYIPCGKITILQGDPGCGKSTMIMDLIAKLTTGRILPDGRVLTPINVIYQCSEDGLADTIKPRLERAKANCKRVGYVDEDLFGLTLDDERFRNAMCDMDARLLVIDPFQAYVGDTDLSSAVGMRKVLRRLSVWASSFNCAVLLVGHLNKKSGSNELYRGLGSIDLVAAARSVLQVETDADDNTIRVLKQIKSSLAPKGTDRTFTINQNGLVEWDIVTLKIEQMTARAIIEEYEPKNKQEKAAKMLCRILADGPVPSLEAENKLMSQGISIRTIKLAKKMIGVTSKKIQNLWYWCLPTSDAKYPTIKEEKTEILEQ